MSKSTGISREYAPLFDEFRKDKEPLKLNSELARLRTLTIMVGNFLEDELTKQRRSDKGVNYPLLVQMAGEVKNIIEAISRVAERAKKIEEGLVLKIDINADFLKRFIRDVVLSVVTDPALRKQIVFKSETFMMELTTRGQRELIEIENSMLEEAEDDDGVTYFLPPVRFKDQ